PGGAGGGAPRAAAGAFPPLAWGPGGFRGYPPLPPADGRPRDELLPAGAPRPAGARGGGGGPAAGDDHARARPRPDRPPEDGHRGGGVRGARRLALLEAARAADRPGVPPLPAGGGRRQDAPRDPPPPCGRLPHLSRIADAAGVFVSPHGRDACQLVTPGHGGVETTAADFRPLPRTPSAAVPVP